MTCPRCGKPTTDDQRFCSQCGTVLGEVAFFDTLAAVGQVLDGRYRLRYLVGTGAMGAVYRAEVEGLGHAVAVKILHPSLAADTTARRRLENEARLASQIDHPNIVSILDFRSTPGLTYLVMEYLSGESLAEVLASVGYLGVRRAIHIARQLLAALEASHRLGVLHRDLKPENIYLIAQADQLDFVKVLDFGMATAGQNPDEARITAHGHVCGTPAYMSPEQAQGHELTLHSDLYSVGVILYETLTGSNPFLGATAPDTLLSQVTLTPARPSTVRSDALIPPYLDALVMRALRKSPTDRFASATEFRQVLEGLVLARQRPEPGEDEGRALVTCPECGRPMRLTERQCSGCGQELRSGAHSIEEILPPEMITALQASDDASGEIRLAPTSSITPRPALGWDVPMVGLGAELDRLRELFVGPAAGQYLRIIGASGMGKGRLAREAARMAERAGFGVVWCEPDMLPGFAPLGPLQRAAAQLLGLSDPPANEGELEAAATASGFEAAHRRGLVEFFGLGPRPKDPADVRRARRAEAWRALQRSGTQRRPMLLVFRDLDRFDAPSQELVAALATLTPGNHPLHVVVTQEPQLLLLWPDTTRTLTVPPLSSKEATELATLLLDRARIAGDAGRVAAASGGSPMTVIELVRLLAIDAAVRFPRSLTEVINQRIGRLPAIARMQLHAMAVLGRPSTPKTISTLVSEVQAEQGALAFLAEQGFLTLERSGWRPSHRLHREMAYASLPAAVREELHRQAAELALDEGAAAAFVGYHLYEAGDGQAAIPYLLEAGWQAVEALDDAMAAQHFQRVLRVLPSPPETFRGSREPWLSATLGVATALADGGDLQSAVGLLRAAAQRAARVGWRAEQERCERQRQRLRAREDAAGSRPS
ncbi:MAG: protein kinase [Deltaproteobacteria bacterium]|nr:protein kinase [Deltaproteobacteria bacterium]